MTSLLKRKLVEDADLFVADRVGSSATRAQVLADFNQGGVSRQRKGARKPLKSAEILAQRDGATHDGLPGRARTAGNGVDKKLKRRIESIARRPAKAARKDDGLWSVARKVPPRATLVEQPRTRSNALYDAWEPSAESVELDAALRHHNPPPVKPPTTLGKHADFTRVKPPLAVPLPDPGASYNPTDVDHDRLLRDAHRMYEDEDHKAAPAKAIKAALDSAQKELAGQQRWQLAALDVDQRAEEDEIAEASTTVIERRSLKPKPTKLKKRAASNRRAEAALQLIRAHERQQRHAFNTLPSVSRHLRRRSQAQLEAQAEREAREHNRLATKGVRKAPAQAVDFQTGDELAESLRQLKPEGSLWRDWSHSAARRGKVELDHGQGGKTKRAKGARTKEVERHFWKKAM